MSPASRAITCLNSLPQNNSFTDEAMPVSEVNIRAARSDSREAYFHSLRNLSSVTSKFLSTPYVPADLLGHFSHTHLPQAPMPQSSSI